MDGVLQLSADMAESMNKIIAAAEPGDIVTMSIVQDGKEITLL